MRQKISRHIIDTKKILIVVFLLVKHVFQSGVSKTNRKSVKRFFFTTAFFHDFNKNRDFLGIVVCGKLFASRNKTAIAYFIAKQAVTIRFLNI